MFSFARSVKSLYTYNYVLYNFACVVYSISCALQYIGSCLQRVLLQWTLGYNEQIFFEKKFLIDFKVKKERAFVVLLL